MEASVPTVTARVAQECKVCVIADERGERILKSPSNRGQKNRIAFRFSCCGVTSVNSSLSGTSDFHLEITMSHKSGDRARADKQRKKRRLRRSELRLLRRVSSPSGDKNSGEVTPAEKA